jgi:hypothetical protein
MSELLFKRVARVVLSAPGASDRLLDGFRVVFQIEKSLGEISSTPATSIITIYNLNERSRSFVEQSGARINLEVAYQGRNETPVFRNIIFGDIKSVNHEKVAADITTKIEAIDGINAYQNSRINQSFDSGATAKQVFNTLARAMGLPLGDIRGIKDNQFLTGYVVSGMVRDQLDALTRRLDAKWSIQDGQLVVLPKGQSSSESIIVLSPETGLIGSPSKKEENTVQFKALLNAKLRINRRVQLNSRFLKGDYTVSKVIHSGDTDSGPWQSSCEATI